MGTQNREGLEKALGQLRGVTAARICYDDAGEITEVHVAAVPGSRAKNIARDVRSYLAAAQGIDVHHRKISVAVQDDPRSAGQPAGRAPGNAPGQRILFNSVNLVVEGLGCEVQVELGSGGRVLAGTATGVPATLGTERLVFAATLDALTKLVSDDVKLLPGDLTLTQVGGGEVIVVEVLLIRTRLEQQLIGACLVGQDRHRSVVFAVLDAVNRVLTRLAPKRWVEYRVEPEPLSEETESKE